MSIKVVCPQGHTLSVSDGFAGKAGLCPVCRARVEVPQHRVPPVSEDAILEMLNTQPAGLATRAAGVAVQPTPEAPPRERTTPPKKNCDKCHQEILTGTHICPYCHTYIANLADF
jgi:hypothetical protein